MPCRIKNKPIGVAHLGILMFLCLCVLVQMLGVPATLLNPAGAADSLEGSVLEGFAVPPTLVRPTLTEHSSLVVHTQPCWHSTGLAAVPFHPPVWTFSLHSGLPLSSEL